MMDIKQMGPHNIKDDGSGAVACLECKSNNFKLQSVDRDADAIVVECNQCHALYQFFIYDLDGWTPKEVLH